MSFWTAVVILFAIACWTWLRTQKYRALGKSNGRYDHTAREHELESEVEQMRQRIAVLERIATDEQRGKDLAREIESLRD
ncbi:MAG: hypothetical protein P8Y58_01450 [Novosphingobium sp.]|jgi:hypothetical protein